VAGVVAAAGSMATAHCSGCELPFPEKAMKTHITEGTVPFCTCGEPAKPDILFFGEQLPYEYFASANKLKRVDLVLAIGTSLSVFPFSGVPNLIRQEATIVFVNQTKIDCVLDRCPEPMMLEGDIDEIAGKIAASAGWQSDLNALQSAVV
jgi:NAD-dependent histone deacetylase SIR2